MITASVLTFDSTGVPGRQPLMSDVCAPVVMAPRSNNHQYRPVRRRREENTRHVTLVRDRGWLCAGALVNGTYDTDHASLEGSLSALLS